MMKKITTFAILILLLSLLAACVEALPPTPTPTPTPTLDELFDDFVEQAKDESAKLTKEALEALETWLAQVWETLKFWETSKTPCEPTTEPPKLTIGKRAVIKITEDPKILRCRKSPGTKGKDDSDITARLESGTKVTVKDGPCGKDGFDWWRVDPPSQEPCWAASKWLYPVTTVAPPPEVPPSEPVCNTPFLTDEQLEDFDSMTESQIREFLTSHGSYFREPIQDIDGQTFDPPAVIAQAAREYRISPKVILATLEKEHNGVTKATRPNDKRMRFLMGCISPSTAREQLTCAAERFRAYHDRLTSTGKSQSGWQVGVPKTTEDGVTVTPATRAVAGQFTYTPYAGVQWDGNQPSVGGVFLFYEAWNRFGFGGTDQ